MRKTIGIDVSKDFLDVASYDGSTFIHKHYAHNGKKSFQQIQSDFNIGSDDLITMEATGVYHLKLAHYFLDKGYQVAVENPLKIKRYAELKLMRAKTDRADAQLIAQYGYELSPSLYQPRPIERENLLLLVKGVEELQQTQQQYRNRLHSLEKRIHKPLKLVKQIKQLLSQLERQIKALEKEISMEIEVIAPTEEDLLRSIPGVGPRLSSLIIAYFGDFKDFETAKQVASFAGVNPNPRESGSSIKMRGSISKKGHSYLRKTLYMAAIAAKRFNPKCKVFYERLLENGKSKKVALIAVMNKLMRQIFAVVKYRQKYDPTFEERKFVTAKVKLLKSGKK